MNRFTFEEFQKLLVDSFERINNEFRSNNIFWWANSGTLLGTIRDGGMIDWDDDMDMSMFNIDFFQNKDKIISILDSMNWELADASEIKGLDVMRLFSKEKIIVEYKGNEYITKPYIDIMISVPTKGNSKIKSTLWSVACNYAWIYGNFYFILPKMGWIKGKKVKIGFIRNFLAFLSKVITFPFMFWVPIYQNKKLKKIINDSDYYQPFYCWNNKGLNYRYKNKNENFITKDFNGIQINVPKKYEQELEIWYGSSWKELPINEKRIPHNLLLTPNNGTDYKINPFLIK